MKSRRGQEKPAQERLEVTWEDQNLGVQVIGQVKGCPYLVKHTNLSYLYLGTILYYHATKTSSLSLLTHSF
jgi:hypothetical protein